MGVEIISHLTGDIFSPSETFICIQTATSDVTLTLSSHLQNPITIAYTIQLSALTSFVTSLLYVHPPLLKAVETFTSLYVL